MSTLLDIKDTVRYEVIDRVVDQYSMQDKIKIRKLTCEIIDIRSTEDSRYKIKSHTGKIEDKWVLDKDLYGSIRPIKVDIEHLTPYVGKIKALNVFGDYYPFYAFDIKTSLYLFNMKIVTNDHSRAIEKFRNRIALERFYIVRIYRATISETPYTFENGQQFLDKSGTQKATVYGVMVDKTPVDLSDLEF